MNEYLVSGETGIWIQDSLSALPIATSYDTLILRKTKISPKSHINLNHIRNKVVFSFNSSWIN